MAKSKNQNNQRPLDFTLINNLSIENYYILDASAILEDPDIENYYKNYKGFEKSGCFIITPICLNEIDNQKNRKRNEHNCFYGILRKYLKINKLSEGCLINDKDYLIYFPFNFRIIKNTKYNYLPNFSDKILLCFAIELKKNSKKSKEVSIISGDVLLRVLCAEENIKYIYIKKETKELKIKYITENNKSDISNPKISMQHSIIIEESLAKPEVLKRHKILRTKFSVKDNWHLHIVEITKPETAVKEIQEAMVEDKPFYLHIYDEGEKLIVVFKDKVFNLDPNNKLTWQEARAFGAGKLGIPAEQLDFYPTKISEEDDWFNK